MKKVLILRNFANKVSIDTYNLQEIGLGKAFVRKGFDCDVIYYSPKNMPDQVYYRNGSNKLTIKWIKAIKFMSNSIYYSILKKEKLQQYYMIITTEYNQIMTFLLSIISNNNLVLYHGPYQNNKNRFIQHFYDCIITPVLVKRIKKVFTKSEIAKRYLYTKGFRNIKTIGVGLNTSKLEEVSVQSKVLPCSSENKYLLYIGVLDERRNIEFMFRVLSRLLKIDNSINLILVGNGSEKDTTRYFSLAERLKIRDHILYYKELDQSDLKYLYMLSELFLFPSSYDIFGMVLLESMYYKLPVISTVNGGSETLISNKKSGLIIERLDESLWTDNILWLLQNNDFRSEMGVRANKVIEENYTWDKVIERLI